MRATMILGWLLGALWSAPLVVMLVFGPSAVEDNQPPPRWPDVSDPMGTLPRRFDVAFDRSFGLRPWLLASYNRVFVLALGAPSLSPSTTAPSRRVLPGADGQLFYALGSTELHRAATPWPPAIRQAWRDEMSRRSAWFRARGVRYVVVVAPDKQTVFDEALPHWAQRVGEPWLDTFLRDLATAGVMAVDVRPSLLAARQIARPYSRTDSHWNDFGACVAASEILAALELAPPTCTPVTTRLAPGGDQAALLGLAGVLDEEAVHPLRAATAPLAAPVDALGTDIAVLSGDSFAHALAPYLSRAFASLGRALTDELNGAQVLATSPVVVIDELVERKLARHPPPAELPTR